MARSLADKFSKSKPRASDVQPTSSEPKSNLAVVDRTSPLTEKDRLYINSFWSSSLISDQFLKDDFQTTYSRELLEHEVGFQTFMTQFVQLCRNKRNESFHLWNESQTIQSWIMPVMQALGWWNQETDPCIPEASFSQETPRGRRQFYIDRLFIADAKFKKYIQGDVSAEKQLEYAKKFAILPLEAKYWDRMEKYRKGNIGDKEDTKRSEGAKKDSASALSPSGQILEYVKLLKGDEPPRNHFGIVTDGKTWRLHHAQFPEGKHYEFNLGGLFLHLKDELDSGAPISAKRQRIFEEAAKYFYFFFSKSCLFNADEPTFVDSLITYSKKYVTKAEDDLKQRFIDAMKYACNGFARSCKANREEVDKNRIRDLAESHLFNILFIKSCEANNVLPLYIPAYREQSLTSIIEKIKRFDPVMDDEANEEVNLQPAFKDFRYKNNGVDLFNSLMNLTDIVQEGSDPKKDFGFTITGFKESIFQEEDKKFIRRHPLSNIEMVRILFQVGYLEEDGVWKQIPYSSFTPRQLGSIYESFLEFVIDIAEDDLEYAKKQWKVMSKKTKDMLKEGRAIKVPVAKRGELYFTPNNKDRKASGAYYTSDEVVEHIVEETLSSLCKGKKPDQILKLRVCDPAMGSGHFLNEALDYLTNQ